MAKGYEVGTAYVTIMPQTKSLTKELSNSISSSGFASACAKEGKAGGAGFASGITGALKGAALLGAGVTAGKALVDGIGQAINQYATFEQLEGGVEKIFDQADTAQIFADASNAYKDLNMSANDYLESINQVGAAFAATMGDQAGYDTARQGMLAIADYASGTGRNLDELNDKFALITRSTGSYQSIADQFSGILPATSEAFLEQAKAAGYLGDEYTSLTEVPIDEYQQAVTNMLTQGVTDMGLYGNTVAESTETISGSIAMTESAWANFVTELGKSDGDVSTATTNLTEAVGAVLKNIGEEIPVIIQNAMAALPQLAEEATTWLLTQTNTALETYGPEIEAFFTALPGNVGTWINGAISTLFEAGNSLIGEIVKGLNGGDEHATLETTITNLPETVKGWITGAAETLQEKGREFIAGLLFGTTEVTDGELKTKIEGLPGEIVGFIGDVSSTLLEIGSGLLSGLLQGIYEIVPDVATFFLGLPSSILDIIGSLATTLFDTGKDLLGGLVDGITDKRDGDLSTELSGLPEKALGFVGDTLSTLGQKGREFVQGFFNGVSEFTGSDLATNLASFAGVAAGFVGETISTLVQAGIDFIMGFLTGAQQEQDGESATWFSGFLDLIKGIITTGIDVVTFLGEIGTQLISGFLDGVTGGKWSEIKKWFGDLPGEIKKKIGDVSKKLTDKGKNLMTGFKSGIDNIAPGIVTFFTGLPGSIVSTIGDVTKTLLDKGKNILQGLFDGIKNIFDKPDGVSNFFSNLMETIKGLIPDPIGALVGIGEDVINGFITGIQNISLKPILETIFGTDLANAICGVLGIESPSKVTKEFGKFTTQGFADGLKDSGATWSVRTNAGSLKDEVTGGLGDTSSLLYGSGKSATNSFANGIGNQDAITKVGTAAGSVRDKVTGALSYFDTWTWGKHLVDNFAAGMEYAHSYTQQTYSAIANSINRLFGHSVPKEGPLKDDDVWGYHFMQNIVNGMLKGQPLLEETMLGITSMMDDTIGNDYSLSVDAATPANRPLVRMDVTGPWYVRDDNDIELIAERLNGLINAQIAGSLA